MFEKESLRRIAYQAEKLQKESKELLEQWDDLDVRAREEEMLRMTRLIRTLGRLLRNIRNGLE